MTECDWRIGEDRKLLQKIARAGCKQLLIGLNRWCFAIGYGFQTS